MNVVFILTSLISKTQNVNITVFLLVFFVVSVSLVPSSYSDYPSPLQQIRDGVAPEDIQCNENRIHAVRANVDHLCVTEQTAEKMNWKIIKVEFATSEKTTNNIEQSNNEPSFGSNVVSQPQIISNDVDDKQVTVDSDIINKKTQLKPLLNPTNISDIIPKDITFDYVLKMPPDDKGSFAQKMALFFDDDITDINNGGNRYVTKKGQMQFFDSNIYDWGFKYTFFGKDRIHLDKAEEVTFAMLDELGVTLDETVTIQEGFAPINNYSYKFSQSIDSIHIRGNEITTVFDTGYTFIYIGNWNDNLSAINLYDLKESLQAGRDHIFSYDDLLLPDCNIAYNSDHDDNMPTVKIMNGRPLYQTYAATCQTPYMDGHYHWYEVYVDALTGKPLFARNLWVY